MLSLGGINKAFKYKTMKKETKEKIDKYYIKGTDASPEVNLRENYFSEWKDKEGKTWLVQSYDLSQFFPDEKGFFLKLSSCDSSWWKESALEDLTEKELKKVAKTSGLTLKELKELPAISFLDSVDAYWGYFSQSPEKTMKAKTIDEAVEKITS